MSWYNPDDAITVAKEGWYPAIITGTETKHSNSGMFMEVVSFRVFTPKTTISLKDYFHEKNLWKYKRLAGALGQAAQFESAEFGAGNHKGQPFEVYLIVEESDQYGDQNKINKFDSDKTNTDGIPSNADTSSAQPSQRQGAAAGGYDSPVGSAPINHDDIPF